MVGNDDVAHEVFYYSAGVDDLHSIQAPPPGLSVIAGTAPGTQLAQSIINEGRGALHNPDLIFSAGFEGSSNHIH